MPRTAPQQAARRRVVLSRGAPSRPLSIAQPAKAGWNFLSEPWFKNSLFLVTDLLGLVLAHRAAERITPRWMPVSLAITRPLHHPALYLPFFAVVAYAFAGAGSFELRRPEAELELGVKALSLFFLTLASFTVAFGEKPAASLPLIVLWFGFALVLVLGLRFLLRALYATLWSRGFGRQAAVVAGAPEELAALHDHLSIQRHAGYDVRGVLLPDRDYLPDAHKSAWPVLGCLDEWESIIERCGARTLLLLAPEHGLTGEPWLLNLVERCHAKGIAVGIESPILGLREVQSQRDGYSGLLSLQAGVRWAERIQQSVKVAMDYSIALVGSMITLAAAPVIALLLKAEDGGPLFYHREFVDRDGCIRYYLKFRTMVQGADKGPPDDAILQSQYADKHKLVDDPRVLCVGKFLRKFSIDELPQFFSVLSGRLSFVGPRVISGAEIYRYGDRLEKLLSVKPGMTGYWQVMGRQTTTYAERVRMDMFYIDHWSIWLDLVIICKTFWKVISAEGAC